MDEVTLSSKNQIGVARDAGAQMIVVTRGDTVIILPRPRSWTNALRGLAAESYPKDYLENERHAWD
jgi:hypothetical protein